MSFIINPMNNFINQLSGAEQKLYQGIYHDNYEAIKEAVEEGADLNRIIKKSFLSENKYPLRELIIEDSSNDIVKLLLELGANPNYTDKSGFTLLMRSCGAESWGVNYKNIEHYFDLLLDHGANVNETTSSGFTALDFAVQYNKGKYRIDRLLRKGTKVSLNTLKAIKECIYDYDADYKTLKYVFNLCKDLNDKKHILDPEISSALDGDFTKVVEIFKSHNLSSKNKKLILNLAACFADIDSFRFLEENIKLPDIKINNLIALSSKYGNISVIKYFLDEKNIDVNTTLGYNFGKAETMLKYAIENDNSDLVKYLLSKNAKAEGYYEGLIINNGDTELLDILLENNLICTKEGVFSLLNSVAFNQSISVLKYIVGHPKINKICNKKELLTRMVDYICNWHPENIEMLSYCISNGGEISKKALKRAFDKSLSLEPVKFLISHGADINILTDANIMDSCIFWSIRKGHFEKVKFLVENGLKVDERVISWAKNSLSSHILEYLKTHNS